MKRVLAIALCAIALLCLVPLSAIADAPATVTGRVAAQELGASSVEPVAEQLLFTRTVNLAKGASSVYIRLTQELVNGKEITVRFTGSNPVLRGQQDWLFAMDVAPDSVEDAENGWKIAHYSSASLARGWQSAYAYNDAKDANGNIVVAKGDYNLVRVVGGAEATTIDRVALVGGELAAHPGKSVMVAGKSAQEIVRDMKVGWNLGNTMDSYAGNSAGAVATLDRADIEIERYWGNPTTTPEIIQFVKSQGFNAVRLPVSWFQHVYDDGRDASDPSSVYHIDEAWMARVHEIVDYCYDAGLYVTINTHHEKLWLETPQFGDDGAHREQLKAELSAIWKQIAQEFSDYDQRVVFEGLNEPRATGDGISHDREWGSPTAGDVETLNALSQAFRDTVRSVESPYRDTRLLIVPTSSGSTQLPMITKIKVPTLADGVTPDPYVGVSAHPYEPYHFAAASDESWMDHTWSQPNQVALEQVMYRMYATFTSKGIPVVLDEFNAQDCGNTDERVKWARDYLSLARGYGMTCFLWDNGGTGTNSFGKQTGYVNRAAAPVAWNNDDQARLARAIVAAATDESTVAWRSACNTAIPGAASPNGLQLNDQAATTTGATVCTSAVRWSQIEAGDVAVEFEGDRPTLVMTNKDGNGWTTADPSWVAWNASASGGVAYFWPDHIKRLWTSSTKNAESGVVHTTDALRRIKLTTSGASTAVKRFVLTGVAALPDVSNGSYGQGVGVRLLYTRPFTLTSGDASKPWNTVAINTENPELAGKDFAVRYTGDTPYLVFVDMLADHGWHGWTQVRPYAVASAHDGTGHKVAFFSRDDVDEQWQANRARDNEAFQYDSVSVALDSGTCNLVELVALGGDVAARPAMRSSARSLDEIVDSLYAGYNLGGHLESNYVPSTPTRDGGWGDADLDLEAHWARGVYITRETIHDLKARGFRAIRLPVTWFQHLYDYEGNRYHIDRAWMARVHEVVDWCLEEDLYVIVNMHHEDWIDRADLDTAYDATDLPQKFAAVWTQIAAEFDGYDQRLVFEAMNEPHAAGDTTDREWNQPNAGDVRTINRLNADFVALIRSLDPDGSKGHKTRMLMVPTYAASSTAAASTGFILPDDPSNCTAVSLHCYTPHSYTHYLQKRELADDDGSTNVFTDTYSIQVDQAFEGIRSRFTSKGMRVVLGEFGCYYCTEARQPDRLRWMTQFATHAKELGIPMLYWRMDKSVGSSVIWSVYDEVNHQFSSLSSEMMDKWFSILGDDSVMWKGRAAIDEGEHVDIADGVTLLADERNVTTSASTYVRLPLTWSELAGCEVAVKYAGGMPRMGMLNGWSGDWWGIEPDAVDVESGIAYYSARSLRVRWEETEIGNSPGQHYSVDDLTHVLLLPDSNFMSPDFTVSEVAVIHKHEWGYWTPVGNATCTEEGVESRTCANGVHEAHSQTRTSAALGHEWGQPTYQWSSDYSSVSASATCARDGAHVLTETVTPRYVVTVEASEGAPGQGVYTAAFSQLPFTTQVKTVTIPASAGGNDSGSGEGEGSGTDRPGSGGNESGSEGGGENGGGNVGNGDGNGNGSVSSGDAGNESGNGNGGASGNESANGSKDGGSTKSGASHSATTKPVTPIYSLCRADAGDWAYATSIKKATKLLKSGWSFAGVAFYTAKSGVKVYELVHKKSKKHYYTTSAKQVKKLTKKGWKKAGVAFYAAKSGVKVYRLKDKKTGAVRLVRGASRVKQLKRAGYTNLGVAFEALA